MSRALLIILIAIFGSFARGSGAIRCEDLFKAPSKVQSPAIKNGLGVDEQTEASARKAAYLSETFRKGSTSFIPAKRFGEMLWALDEEARVEWISAIANNYRKIPKKDPNPLAPWHIGGRRLLDYSLTLAERFDLKFAQVVPVHGARGAFNEYIENQANLFHTEVSPGKISAIIDFLKRDLIELQEKLRGGDLKVLLAGSLINGKASLVSSDIDLTLGDLRLRSELVRWQSKIQEMLDANVVLEAHGEPASFYGKINPVVIEITARGANLLVYPPARVAQQERELISATPTVYPFDN